MNPPPPPLSCSLRSYLDTLQHLEKHLGGPHPRPFLFGKSPSLADFGLAGQLYQSTGQHWEGGEQKGVVAVHSGPLHLHLRRLMYSSYTLSTRKFHTPFGLHQQLSFSEKESSAKILQSLIRSWPSQQTHPKLAIAETRGYQPALCIFF